VDERSIADARSRGLGVVALLCGLAATGLTWHWALQDGSYDFKAALVGPVALVVGIGMLIQGAEIPLDGITPRTRMWGLAGSVAAIVNLYLLGYFDGVDEAEALGLLKLAIPVVITIVWFLPDRFFGGRGYVPARPPDSPIQPR